MAVNKKKILIFSTLNPYPFWAGSEKLWFDLVRDERVRSGFDFEVVLADSPVTRKKAVELNRPNVRVWFFKHLNISFTRRNLYKLLNTVSGRSTRTLPWYRKIAATECDLVLFNVAALADLSELEFAVSLCKQRKIPYWLLLQHAYEDFFVGSERELQAVTDVSISAKRFVFIARQNRLTLERALCKRLPNVLQTVNALPADTIREAGRIADKRAPGNDGPARLFNLGRFSPKDKAQHLVLEALAGEKWEARDWTFTFVGISGFEAKYLEKMTRYFGIDAGRIKITPHTDDVLSEISVHDVLVMPSAAEGTPFSMIEAMACGRPAVGTPVGGIPELITDGKTGWLARSTSTSDVADALERMWADRENWERIGSAARQRVQSEFNEELTFRGVLEALAADAG